ncbi:MAG: DUF1800 domain-containing protein [Verrucomicrobiota bacterium]
MSVIFQDMTPQQAWEPLPDMLWNADSAAHLLRRIGFSARPADIQRALVAGPRETVDQAFSGVDFDVPSKTWDAHLEVQYLRRQMRNKDPEERRALQRKVQKAIREAYNEFAMDWLEFARKPEASAQEKYVLFLESIFVVSSNKVRNAGMIYDHGNLLRREGFDSYVDLVKSISRSPAMIQYLDLQQSQKKAPNENFARELMELFTLGEGNYTEKDIKEAARAFTGYGYRSSEHYFSEYRFTSNRYDSGKKTVFGNSGRWNGDEVIEMVFEQPGAKTFMPRELCLYYLSETPLPEEILRPLGESWARQDFDQEWLLRKLFTSRIFYAEQFRGNLIKSPFHFYIGLCQDLNLDVLPVPTRLIGQFRNMGQDFQNPPNVRGWLGGKHWITSSTLSARQLMARNLLYPPKEDRYNADERMRLEEARDDGKGPFAVQPDMIQPWLKRDNDELVEILCRYFLPQPPSPSFKSKLVAHVDVAEKYRYERVRQALLALLQSPVYQLS